jgi:hypothetical protein
LGVVKPNIKLNIFSNPEIMGIFSGLQYFTSDED